MSLSTAVATLRLPLVALAVVLVAAAPMLTPVQGRASAPKPYIAASVPVAGGCIVLGREWAGVKVFLVQRRLGTSYEKDRYQQGTYDAVKQFQHRRELRATGRVNRNTWQALGFSRSFCMDRFTMQPKVGVGANSDRRIDTMIHWAKRQVGTRYVWGGAGPLGYDCSGLSLQAMYAGGRVIPAVTTKLHQRQDFATATAIYESGMRRVPLADRRRGDLIFYGSTGSITHMAIYLGHNRVVEAVRPRVQVSGIRGHGVSLKPRVVRPFNR